VKASEVPVVICNGRSVLRSPSIQELADCLGLNSNIEATHVRDVIIVGAGPRVSRQRFTRRRKAWMFWSSRRALPAARRDRVRD